MEGAAPTRAIDPPGLSHHLDLPASTALGVDELPAADGSHASAETDLANTLTFRNLTRIMHRNFLNKARLLRAVIASSRHFRKRSMITPDPPFGKGKNHIPQSDLLSRPEGPISTWPGA